MHLGQKQKSIPLAAPTYDLRPESFSVVFLKGAHYDVQSIRCEAHTFIIRVEACTLIYDCLERRRQAWISLRKLIKRARLLHVSSRSFDNCLVKCKGSTTMYCSGIVMDEIRDLE